MRIPENISEGNESRFWNIFEGQAVEFKCPICGALGEADLPYKSADEREEIKERLEEAEEVEEDTETIAEGPEEIEYAS